MKIFFWRQKSEVAPLVTDIESLRHEIRNALLGIKLEKNKLANALGDQAKALMGIRAHMERIDRALKPQNGAGERV